MMGGRVWVESEPVKGNTFHFTALFSIDTGDQEAKPSTAGTSKTLAGERTPVVDDNAPLPASATSAPIGVISSTASGAEPWDRPLNILLADDSPDNRLLIRAFFKRTPHRLDEAEDGEAALWKFGVGRYDLILMDVQMRCSTGSRRRGGFAGWSARAEPIPSR